jgi:hypothetical protein
LGLESFEIDEKQTKSRNRHKEIFLLECSYLDHQIKNGSKKFTKENYLLTGEKALAGIAALQRQMS